MDVNFHWSTLHVPREDGPDEHMDAYFAFPGEGGPFPGIVVFQEIFGVNEHIREVCRRIAAHGYVVVAPDIYHRSVQRLELGYEARDVAVGREHKDKCTIEGLLADTRGAIKALHDRDDVSEGKLGCVGFCFGGHVAFIAATLSEFAATACFYGGGITTMRPGGGEPSIKLAHEIKGRILMLYGDDDKGIPPEQVDEVRNALADAGLRYEVRTFIGAGHGFACDKRLSYHVGAANDAWKLVFDMWDAELKQA
ncbi:MAG: dienelactone hydrolase family protein [Planctomycetes bacterium]|nr:dienelactone hydrolase family protein [Planctomycetota bacterium]